MTAEDAAFLQRLLDGLGDGTTPMADTDEKPSVCSSDVACALPNYASGEGGPPHKLSRYTRAEVVDVRDATYDGPRGVAPEKVLGLHVHQSSSTLLAPTARPDGPSLYWSPSTRCMPFVLAEARLREEWLATDVHVGDTIHVIGSWQMHDTKPTIILSSFGATDMPLLILHPDVIISASRLASVASCMRKPMLQERIRTPSDSTYVAVLGTMVHGLLQACLVASGDVDPVTSPLPPPLPFDAPSTWTRLGNFTAAFLTAEVERQITQARSALLLTGVGTEKVRHDLYEAIPSLLRFAAKYLAPRDGGKDTGAVLEDPRTGTPMHASIREVLSTEGDIVSPMYGLKGRLDVIVDVAVRTSTGTMHVPLPLEVKTGRVTSSMEHMAQTSLYTLLLSDAMGTHVDMGLLLYVQSEAMQCVRPQPKELRNLILARNDMAAYKARMPPLWHEEAAASVPNDHTLSPASEDSFAFALDEAALAAVPLDVEEVPTPFLAPPIDSAFKCARCYSRDACALYRRVFETPPTASSPVAALYDESTSHLTPTDVAFFRRWDALLSREERGLSRYQHELWTLSADERAALGRCVPHATIRSLRGARVVLDTGTAPGLFAPDDLISLAVAHPVRAFLSRGRVVSLEGTSLQLELETSIAPLLTQLQMRYRFQSVTWALRVDMDDLMAMMGVPRYNLACLFYRDAPPRVTKLRERIVHHAPPHWDVLSKAHQASVQRWAATCNAEQRRAIERALSAQDYTLVLGMPGTGKSTTIAVLVRLLAELGQRVLLCSHTHSAVDTIVAKLVDTPVLRLGPLHRIHPRVRSCALAARLGQEASVEALQRMVSTAPIVAATCLATSDAALALQSFDVCIIDEASQITLPTCVGPLRLANRFVMIGDHHQLAPLVRDAEAAEHGMHTSLFQQLCTRYPDAVVELCVQYRMNAAIMRLSNTLIYQGRLQCADEHVAQSCVPLPTKPGVPPWLQAVCAPSQRVLFVDTDRVGAYEQRTDALVENEKEAYIVQACHQAFLDHGLDTSEVGILTPYRQQAKVLRRICPTAEVLTIDQAQGRDWRIVLLSLVRSNDGGHIGELLRDRQRVNVMLTRAQSKLVLVGSRSTMAAGPTATVMTQCLALLAESDAIVEAVVNAPVCRPAPSSPARTRTVKKARRSPPAGIVREVLEEQGVPRL
ncbi:DNA replication endonuclease-helicase Dna2 [Malassezia pachydermatis]|uniref:DNA helicase n=1 Tax=Malassezia pachydermatis TaxID=77020 RepID=A0A0M9VNA7_9BASI|nr:dna replication helicase [Malassezia pachydermatis]KOS13149.1 dna replication helicase [Malassezia pachydermatis]